MAAISSLLTQHSFLLKLGGDEVKITSTNIQIGVNNGCNLVKTGSNSSSYAIQKGNISSTGTIRVTVIDTPDGSCNDSIKALEQALNLAVKEKVPSKYTKSVLLFLNDPVGNKALAISFSGFVSNMYALSTNNDLVEYHADITLHDPSTLKLE